jgi:hypothetical protein
MGNVCNLKALKLSPNNFMGKSIGYGHEYSSVLVFMGKSIGQLADMEELHNGVKFCLWFCIRNSFCQTLHSKIHEPFLKCFRFYQESGSDSSLSNYKLLELGQTEQQLGS